MKENVRITVDKNIRRVSTENHCKYVVFPRMYIYNQRWAKVTTLRALTIFLEALFHLEKRLGGWTGV
jgi:hypothetical protein